MTGRADWDMDLADDLAQIIVEGTDIEWSDAMPAAVAIAKRLERRPETLCGYHGAPDHCDSSKDDATPVFILSVSEAS